MKNYLILDPSLIFKLKTHYSFNAATSSQVPAQILQIATSREIDSSPSFNPHRFNQSLANKTSVRDASNKKIQDILKEPYLLVKVPPPIAGNKILSIAHS